MSLKPSREIAFPFHIGPDGGIAYVEDPYKAYFQHLLVLILTRVGERVMVPQFGSPTHDFLFENINEMTGAELSMRLMEKASIWEPAIKVHEIRPSLQDWANGALTLTVLFSVPPREDVLSTVVEVGGNMTGTTSG